ncbi:MAG: helix-turn-helix domain-containing protein [Clostridia bacterium]|nr:helix-turn-helix domain-containing protein [Clostridia bacterium]
MAYAPELKPLVADMGGIHMDVLYEKRYTRRDDVTHDEQHIHDFYEIYVNLSGDVSFLVEDSVYPISAGAVILTAPNELHRCIYHSDGVHEHFCIWMRELPFAAEVLAHEFAHHKLVVLSEEHRQKLIERCFALYESLTGSENMRFRAMAGFAGILDLICNHRQKGASSSVEKLPENFAGIVDYITCHYMDPTCSVSFLCEQFYISKSTLCRKFQQYFQMTPSYYIESKRFSEAKKLLAVGVSVQDACTASGFSDCSYFILRFRKRFGVTPHQYVRSQR